MWIATTRVHDHPAIAYPLLLHCITAGLVPPFSAFFTSVLERYQVLVLHLHPNSIMILAIFAFWCEAFVSISPSIAVFRSYYSLHLTD
jgi:hypothetical protein